MPSIPAEPKSKEPQIPELIISYSKFLKFIMMCLEVGVGE